MGYMSIQNLYREQTVLLETELFALEKIHGTSAHISWNERQLHLCSGGDPHANFAALFDQDKLKQLLLQLESVVSGNHIVVFGEAYGGKQQRNAWRYGPELRFVAFDVKVDERWLTVPEAEQVARHLGQEFVHYVKIPATLSAIDAERDAISSQAIRNGVTTVDGEFIRREGVVLRPLTEKVDSHGNRIMAKHKRAEERETKTDRPVTTDRIEVIKKAQAIADEYVTPMRLQHILQKLPQPEITDMTRTREVINTMVADVQKEAYGEIEPEQGTWAAVGKRTSQLLKQHLETRLHEGHP